MFGFCKYCWRQTAPLRSLCPAHASGRLAAGDLESLSARYKSGQRRLKHFENAINSLVTADVMEFHKSEFRADVLFGAAGFRTWLAKRRPLVWRALCEARQPENDLDCIRQLIALLYDIPHITAPAMAGYEQATDAIERNPVLTWPILTRMEAFLQSHKDATAGSGGKRSGAGRKPRPQPLP